MGVEPERHAVAPLLSVALRIDNGDETRPVQNMALQAQVRIDAARRRYDAAAADGLSELFGDRARWGRSVGSLLWTHTGAAVPAFEGTCDVRLPLPCSFDFNVAATKYFHALSGGVVPVVLLFSGTVFYYDRAGILQMSPIPWNTEAAFSLPVAAWHEMMEHYYPEGAWLCVGREAFHRLERYKRERSLPTWDCALDRLLDGCKDVAS